MKTPILSSFDGRCFLWIMLVIYIFIDIMRNDSMSGWAKALWVIAIIILPFLGVLLYLIVNGSDMNRRSQEEAERQDAATQDYIRQVAGSGSKNTGSELAKLSELHESGKLSDEEYATAKAKALAD